MGGTGQSQVTPLAPAQSAWWFPGCFWAMPRTQGPCSPQSCAPPPSRPGTRWAGGSSAYREVPERANEEETSGSPGCRQHLGQQAWRGKHHCEQGGQGTPKRLRLSRGCIVTPGWPRRMLGANSEGTGPCQAWPGRTPTPMGAQCRDDPEGGRAWSSDGD